MKLFNKKITSRKHSPNDKHYHTVVDVKRGLKSSDSLSFMTSDIHTGVLTLELIDGDLPYNVNGCKVSATISCPDSTVLEIPCEMLDDNIVEIHLGIEGTYQEGAYTFDLKIDRGNARVVGIPTITYTVLSSIVEKSVDDDKFQILDKLISQTKDRLDRFDIAMSGMTSDSEVREARDGENLLYDRLKRDLDYSKSINAKVEQVAESVTELESNVGNIVQSNLTQLDNRITQVDNRVTQEVSTINSSIADLNLKVDHVAQIDDELVSPYRTWSSEKIDNELSALELVASNIKMSDDSSVEDAINTNKTSILTNTNNINTNTNNIENLTTKVNKSQLVKVTADHGACRGIPNNNANDINTTGFFMGYNAVNAPQTTHGWVYIESLVHDGSHQIQKATDLHDGSKRWIRNQASGIWSEWRDIQSHKLTNNDGTSFSLTNADLNTVTKTGNYVGNDWVNAPNKNYAIVEVVQGTSGMVKQVFTETTSTNQYMRIYRSSTWTAWREL